MGSYLEGFIRQLKPGVDDRAAVEAVFQERNFLDMQGRPDDVVEIKTLILSQYKGSANAFNTHMRKKLTELFHFQIKKAKTESAGCLSALRSALYCGWGGGSDSVHPFFLMSSFNR